jgi:hypothetical protein
MDLDWIWIQQGKNGPEKKEKSYQISAFEVLDGLF